MNGLRLSLGFGGFALATLVAVGNWGGLLSAYGRKKKGGSGGVSFVPLISVICSVVAWLAVKREIGLWSFAPAAIDIGTVTVVTLPFFLLKRALLKRRAGKPHSRARPNDTCTSVCANSERSMFLRMTSLNCRHHSMDCTQPGSRTRRKTPASLHSSATHVSTE
jgi:hypothetical protein